MVTPMNHDKQYMKELEADKGSDEDITKATL